MAAVGLFTPEDVPQPFRHVCHAIACDAPVPPKLLMCLPHWKMVPWGTQRALLAAYVPDQERTKVTTKHYRMAATRAIIAVAEQEGRVIPAIYLRIVGEE